MNISNEHILIGSLLLYILFSSTELNKKTTIKSNNEIINKPTIKSNNEIINKPTIKSNNEIINKLTNENKIKQNYQNILNKKNDIPSYSSSDLKKIMKNESCKIPNKNIAKCVADMIVSTGCVKCSLDSCDKDGSISSSCYNDVSCNKNSCSCNNCSKCNKGYQVYQNMHDSMHNNQYNSMHSSLNNSIYSPNPSMFDDYSNISGNNVNDLEEYNSFSNLYQQNSILNPVNSPLPRIEQYNKRPFNNYAQLTVPRNMGLERELDGSFQKWSRLG